MITLKLTSAECQVLLDSLQRSQIEAPKLKRRLQALLPSPVLPPRFRWIEAWEDYTADPTESPDYVTHEDRFDPKEAA